MTRTFTTFVAPTVFATALFTGTAAEASYVPEAQRILDVVAQTGTKITHKTCTGEDAGNAGFYEIHSNDDGKVTKDELTVCDNNAKGRDYLPTIKHEAIHVAQACQQWDADTTGRTDKWLRKQLKENFGPKAYEKLTSLYDKDHVDIELEAYGMEARPTAEIIEVVKDACAFAF